MSGWLLTLKTPLDEDFDASSLTQLAMLESASEAAKLVLKSPRATRNVNLGELFHVTQLNDNNVVMMQGEFSRLHRLANQWHSASLKIEGNVGSDFAVGMRSGTVEVEGNAGDGLASQMRGGVIHVSGNAGNRVAGPLAGRRSGMSGGRVVIQGNTGHATGFRLRRGMLLIKGNCGDGLGMDMVAGTIAIHGRTGMHLGAGMRRGTIVLGKKLSWDTIRFTEPRPVNLGFAALLANDVKSDSPSLAAALNRGFTRSLGDLTAGGKGEIWMLGED